MADFTIAPSQGDGWKITTPHGHIDYRPVDGMNEIWWVESHKKGHGSELVDLMQAHHPAHTIGWGVTTPDGKRLRDRWHALHPEVSATNGAFEGQFDPSGNNYGEDEFEEDEFEEDDPFFDEPEGYMRYERRHAPTNLNYADKPYRTGQFIPGSVMFTHSPPNPAERWRPQQPLEYNDFDEQVPDPDEQRQQPQPEWPGPLPSFPAVPDVQPADNPWDAVLPWANLGSGVRPDAPQPPQPLNDVTLEHLDILRGNSQDSDFPMLARAYLGTLPLNERIDVLAAAGINHLDHSDPVNELIREMVGSLPDAPPRPPDRASNRPRQAPPDVQSADWHEQWGSWKPISRSKEILHTTPVVAEADVGVSSSNETRKLTFANGQHAVFKPFEGEASLRVGITPETYWRREVAASDVADILGMGDLVPPTSFREHKGKYGSIQRWADNSTPARNMPESIRYDGREDAARAALFDYITANSDRHDGNWLQQNGKLVLIDNGLSFPHTIDSGDYFNYDFWVNASRYQLPMPPEVTQWADKWPEVEAALRAADLEDEAIELTRQRFEAVTSGQYQTVSQLPAFWAAGDGPVPGPMRDHV